ncbi:MAG: hypothetical protein RSG23_08725 [Gordonibacter sp.]|uniref:hypothetical protein n=1 Tax=Gordonibacter sp. TaxID=1968902 RepID=UPI002FC61E59
MGKHLCISVDGGGTQYNHEFTFTTDGYTWLTVLFEELDDAREYAAEVIEQSNGNDKLMFYARRIVQVRTDDFLDSDLCAVDMRVIDRHSECKEK